MYEIRADQIKNRLYITLTGLINHDESRAITELINKEAGCLQAGFACIADLTRFRIRPENAERMLQIQEMLVEAGMSELIRIGDPVYREMLEKSIRKEGYNGRIVYDLETAIKIIEQRE